jgi:hypothetical protein
MRQTVFLIALTSVFAVSSQSAFPKPFSANETVCKQPSALQKKWVDAATWATFAAYIRVCPVKKGNAPVALYIVSVWADLYYADTPERTVTVPMPNPLLMDGAGNQVGTLPVNFPTDPPAELQIEFSQWSGGLPRRIDLCVRSPTASGDQALSPLVYQEGSGRFERVTDSDHPQSRESCHGS